MKAVARTMYGSADVLEFVDVNEPSVADNEVLIRVHAAASAPRCGM
jgi:NADPH:quinone reductase-like Zn-dependent oxidoreductase